MKKMTGSESPDPPSSPPLPIKQEPPNTEENDPSPLSPQHPPKSVESLPESNNNERILNHKEQHEPKRESSSPPPPLPPHPVIPHHHHNHAHLQTNTGSSKVPWLFLQNQNAAMNAHNQRLFGAGLDAHGLGLGGGQGIGGGGILGHGGGHGSAAAAVSGYWRM